MESERTSEVVADSLIKEIRGNYLAIGATLPTERELCDRFSASRPTIREALRIMEFKGYLRQASNKRPVAEKPTIQKIRKRFLMIPTAKPTWSKCANSLRWEPYELLLKVPPR